MNDRTMRAFFFSLVSIFLMAITCLSSCTAKAAPKAEPPKTVMVLVDLSASAVESREDYLASLDKVFENIHLGDHLFIAKITDRSEMDARPFLDNVFRPAGEKPNPYKQELANRKADKDKKNALTGARDQILSYLNGSSKPTPATAILGSLQVAERIFRKDAGQRGILVILSDMVEATRENNFEKIRLDEKGIQRIISREKKNRRIPDLKGVRVYVAGARSKDRNRYYDIRDFWLRYFKETGAVFEKEDYGSVLLGLK